MVAVCFHSLFSSLKSVYLGNAEEVVRQTVQDPRLLELLEQFRRQHAEILRKYEALMAQLKDEQIDSFDDLEKFDKKKADALVKLALQTEPLPMTGKNFGFFGLTSTGKSTIINQIIGENLAEVGACETTKDIQPYNGQGYRLYDIPGRNDDLSYFNMKYIAFWNALTPRIVFITVTIKEMTTVFRLLDAINLRYDIVVNKFDLVKDEERDRFENQIKQQIIDLQLKGVNNLWFISAENPSQFPDWNRMIEYLQKS